VLLGLVLVLHAVLVMAVLQLVPSPRTSASGDTNCTKQSEIKGTDTPFALSAH
jgi:hypothetical protein